MSKKKNRPVIVCLSCENKGQRFMQAAHKAGCTVYLITGQNLEHDDWPRESLEEIFFVEQRDNRYWNMPDVLAGLAHFMRGTKVDRIIALDDFDVEKGSFLREHFRIAGMGETTQRYFRDKLAMRMKAQESGIPVPAFSALFHDEDIHSYVKNVSAPWVVKPRSEATASGITKVHNEEELWKVLNELGGERHQYLVEQFKPGDVYHVDALSVDGKVIFARSSKYLSTPMEVAHDGGIFRSATLEIGNKEDKAVQRLNSKVKKAFGMKLGASHTEFIRCNEDGKFYFLETASRVGGAHIAELVEAASGVNLWEEWAKVEAADVLGKTYKLPRLKSRYSGIVVSLINQPEAHYEHFTDKEIFWTLNKNHHMGLIVQSTKKEKVRSLLDDYAMRIGQLK